MTTSEFLTGLGFIILVSLLLSAAYAGLGRFWLGREDIRVKYTRLFWVGMKGAAVSLLIMLAVIFFSLVTGKDGKPLFTLPTIPTRILLFLLHLLYVTGYIYRVRKVMRQRRAPKEKNNPDAS